MRSLSSLLFVQAVSLAAAGIIVPSSKIIEGPSSKTTLVGPDGSVITSVQQGAKIVTDGHSALVAAPDTLALIKEADHVVEAKLTPAISVKSPLPAIAVIEPAVPVVKSHLEPVLAAHIEPLHTIETHVAPVVLKSEPVIAHHVAQSYATKTTISEHSQSIAHPLPAVKLHLEPAIATYSVPTIEVHAAPIIATKTIQSEQSQAFIHPALVFRPLEAYHVAPAVEAKYAAPVVAVNSRHLAPEVVVETNRVAPVIAKEIFPALPAIGTKTTTSEYSQSVLHPSIQAKAVHAISEIVPVVTAKLIKQHAVPVLAHHAPIFGTETRISENSQTLVSHSW